MRSPARVMMVLVLVGLAGSGCASMTQRQQQTLSGGAIGAASGAALGAIAGNPAIGAVVGGAVGVAAGALWEDIQKTLSGAQKRDTAK